MGRGAGAAIADAMTRTLCRRWIRKRRTQAQLHLTRWNVLRKGQVVELAEHVPNRHLLHAESLEASLSRGSEPFAAACFLQLRNFCEYISHRADITGAASKPGTAGTAVAGQPASIQKESPIPWDIRSRRMVGFALSRAICAGDGERLPRMSPLPSSLHETKSRLQSDTTDHCYDVAAMFGWLA